jgi:hypothetical protein
MRWTIRDMGLLPNDGRAARPGDCQANQVCGR